MGLVYLGSACTLMAQMFCCWGLAKKEKVHVLHNLCIVSSGLGCAFANGFDAICMYERDKVFLFLSQKNPLKKGGFLGGNYK